MKKTVIGIVLIISILSASHFILTPSSVGEEAIFSLRFQFDQNIFPENTHKLIAKIDGPNSDMTETVKFSTRGSVNEFIFKEITDTVFNLIIYTEDISGNLLYSGTKNFSLRDFIHIPTNFILDLKLGKYRKLLIDIQVPHKKYVLKDYPGNPVLSKDDNPEEKSGMTYPCVIFDGGIYKMWFEVKSQDGVGYIYYATSLDGINWQRDRSGPVLTPGTSGTWDMSSVTSPVVIKVNDKYRMYYGGWADKTSRWDVGLAVSSDGINWTKHSEPVFSGAQDQWDRFPVADNILQVKNRFYLYYSGKTEFYDNRIGLAVSEDGYKFTRIKNTPILKPETEWEKPGIIKGSVVKTVTGFIMCYANTLHSNAFGFAYSLDGINWQKEPLNPVYKLTSYSDRIEKINYPNILLNEEGLRIYYMGIKSSKPLEMNINLLIGEN